MTTTILLPWPSSALSGHAKGQWRDKHAPTKSARALAAALTRQAMPIEVPAKGDIPVTVYFWPPDNRGDRTNYPNRLKPYWDGIADALKVNDKRFLPMFIFCEPCRGNGRVEVQI